MGKHLKKCKVCELPFNEENKDLFPIEKHILKNGTFGEHYRQSLCKNCSAKRIIKKVNGNRAYINYLKQNRPCKDCGKHYPYYVMHFDHLKDKVFNIGSCANKNRASLKAEIAKCDIVCANCHAERTHRRIIEKKKNN